MKDMKRRRSRKPRRAAAPETAAISIGPPSDARSEMRRSKIFSTRNRIWTVSSVLKRTLSTIASPGEYLRKGWPTPIIAPWRSARGVTLRVSFSPPRRTSTSSG